VHRPGTQEPLHVSAPLAPDLAAVLESVQVSGGRKAAPQPARSPVRKSNRVATGPTGGRPLEQLPQTTERPSSTERRPRRGAGRRSAR
jgi:hypothetical protein